MNRKSRAHLGTETVEIVKRGWYESEVSGRVDISEEVKACLEGTKVYTPGKLEELLEGIQVGSNKTEIRVTNETSLSAAKRFVVQDKHSRVLCLNFASAKNPGGGFLGGSQAQEESLARSSALYESLVTQQVYYETNRQCHTPLYTDHMILSPNVPVFRNDDGDLLSEPYPLSILTMPAVNAGAVRKNKPDKVPLIRPFMERRIAMVLAVAAHHRYEHLILGAWGCGVFRNDPEEIAGLFSEALLQDERFSNQFVKVTFAVLDYSDDRRIINPFIKHLSNGEG